MDIRRAERGDDTRWLEAAELLVPEADRGGKLASREEVARALDDRRCYLYLAFSGDVPVGLLSAYRFPDVESGGILVYLYDIEVHRRHRRKGVGAALVNELVQACGKDGVDLIWAGTEASNQPARITFEATGARLEGEAHVEYEWLLKP